MIKDYDAIIIGAGAAGLFCAYQAAKQGKKILLCDHNIKIARKIKISGGGRCNFTNMHAAADHYICPSPHFVKPALKNYKPSDFIQLINQHNILWHEKELGQIFTNEGSQKIIDMLMDLCKKNQVDICFPMQINHIFYNDAQYKVTSNKGEFTASNLVIATGGLSFKGLGASGFGYDIARQFGHSITPLSPALVGFKCREDFCSISGLSLKARVSIGKHSFLHQLLFTHQGLSGPAILQISSYWEKNTSIQINLLPDISFNELISTARKKAPKSSLSSVLSPFWPRKFIGFFLHNIDFSHLNISDLNKKQYQLLSNHIHHWNLIPQATTGYEKAEVTKGGVDVSLIQSKSMESKIQKGLFFIGEVVDVTGQLGGYNFQWAWSSAALAAQHICLD